MTRKKVQSRVKARMDQRTRAQLPLLPALLRAVEQHRTDAAECLTTATSTTDGGQFTANGQRPQRCRHGASGRVHAVDMGTTKRRDLTHDESAAFRSWATVEVLRHTGIRIEEMLELTHHSFVAYTLPTTGEVVPMPYLFQRRFGTEDRPLTRSYIRKCVVATSNAAQITAGGRPLQWRPHDFRRIFVTDAIRSGLPPHIAAKVCGHTTVDTTMGYAAIYPEDVIAHHRAFIARRRAERPSEEYRDLTNQEWDEFLAHFELRKVALGTCGRDHGTPCAHETPASDVHYFESTQLKSLGWKGPTPTSSTGCGKPKSRLVG